MFQLSTHQELYCKAVGDGSMFAKKGSMVADIGAIKYSKRLLGTNNDGLAKNVLNHVARKVTGENLEMIEIKGSGELYLADQGAHILCVGLEPNGAWESLKVESEDLLAFNDAVHYGVTFVGTGVFSQKGLATSKLTYDGPGAQVCIKTKGNPLILQVQPGADVECDPDALVAWTGKNPKMSADINLKTLIGQTSGESYKMKFTEPGQFVIVQPFERESGINISMDDKRYKPEAQGSAGQNSMDNLKGMAQGFMGSGNGQQQQGGGLEGMAKGVIGNLFK